MATEIDKEDHIPPVSFSLIQTENKIRLKENVLLKQLTTTFSNKYFHSYSKKPTDFLTPAWFE